jgi:hypothetical protein
MTNISNHPTTTILLKITNKCGTQGKRSIVQEMIKLKTFPIQVMEPQNSIMPSKLTIKHSDWIINKNNASEPMLESEIIRKCH